MVDTWKLLLKLDEDKLYYTLRDVINILNIHVNLSRSNRVTYPAMKYYLDNGYIKTAKKIRNHYKFTVEDITNIAEFVFLVRELGLPPHKLDRFREFMKNFKKIEE